MQSILCFKKTVTAGFILLFLLCRPSLTADGQSEGLCQALVEHSRIPGGFAVIMSNAGPALPQSLAKQGAFVVHCLATDQAACHRLRESLQPGGLYGTVSAGVWAPPNLPYMQNLINLVIVDPSMLAKGSGSYQQTGRIIQEIQRVLTPLGMVFIGSRQPLPGAMRVLNALKTRLADAGMEAIEIYRPGNTAGGHWLCARKPWPKTIDDWPHYLHGADGNPVATDSMVGPPAHYQWTGAPMWMRSHESDSSISTIVTARGRLFYIEDQAPTSLAGDHPLPDKWCLVARDAFNGAPLWQIPIRRWGWREWKPSWFNTRPGDVPLNIQKRLVATEDRVYITLGYRAPVSAVDARTGRILKTYDETAPTGELLLHENTLVVSRWEDDRIRLMTVDAESGEVLCTSEKTYAGSVVDYIRWRAMHGTSKPAKLDPASNMATDGDVIALLDGKAIAAVDSKTGRERWRTAFPLAKADQNAGGIKTHGNLWVGTMIVKDGAVIHASPYSLAAFSAKTGRCLWTRPKRYIGHLWYEWKDVFVIDGLVWTWGEDLEKTPLKNSGNKQQSLYPTTVKGYDLKTGELKKNVGLGYIFKSHHHHRCYRNKATLRYILASRRGTEYVDLKEGKHTVHNWVRGTCHVGMMPANGLQYAPVHPCVCYIDEKINGMNALAPAGSVIKTVKISDAQRLQKGPAYGKHNKEGKSDADNLTAGPEDWPAFRGNMQRTGSIATKVPAKLNDGWTAQTGGKLSAPIVVKDRLYAARVDAHQVVCFNTQTGKPAWTYTAGARIDSPPAYFRGTVIFGAADGFVYCVDARDGQLAWQFQAAPVQRMIGSFGQLESAWPVHGSVLIVNDTVYFAAGRTSQLDGGLRLYGLDAATGQIRCKTRLSGPDYTVEGLSENFKLPMGSLPDILMLDGDTIVMRGRTFDGALKTIDTKPQLGLSTDFLEDSYFKRVPWRFEGDYGRLLVRDKHSVYYVRMFDSLQGLNPNVYFTPGAQGYLLFGKHIGERKKTWLERIRIRIRAMLLTPSHLFVAGPPDVVDPKDPLGAFEGRKGGVLAIFETATGKKRGEHKLPAPPVFNGIAAAHERLYLTLENGSIISFSNILK